MSKTVDISVKKLMMTVIVLCTLLASVLSVSIRNVLAEEEVKGDFVEYLEMDGESLKTGSLTVNFSYKVEDQDVPVAGFGLEIYQVATVTVENYTAFYILTEEFAPAGVSFDGMTAEDRKGITDKLLAVMAENEAIVPLNTQVSNAEGKVYFEGLQPGMYLVRQNGADGEALKYETITPFLITVPKPSDEVNEAGRHTWNYEVDATPKITLRPRDVGDIDVTKDVGVFLDPNITVENLDGPAEEISISIAYIEDATYYVGLFLDPKGEIPVPFLDNGSNENKNDDYFKPIHIHQGSSGTVTFEKIPTGTYYIFETDEKGKALPMGQEHIDHQEGLENEKYVCVVVLEDGNFSRQSIPLHIEGEAPEGDYPYHIENIYWNASIRGFIKIKKEVKDANGKDLTTDTKFYAGIFKTENGKIVEPAYKVVELVPGQYVTERVPVTPVGGEKTVYGVYEVVLKDGVKQPSRDEYNCLVPTEFQLVDAKTFPFDVKGEGNISLTTEVTESAVTITNTKKTTTPTPTPTPPVSTTITPPVRVTVTQPPSNPPGGGSTNPVATGDTSNVFTYLIILLAAAVIAVAAVVVVKKKKN